MVELVKAAGMEVIDRAETIVGDMDGMMDIDVWLKFPYDGLPEIEVSKNYKCKQAYKVFMNRQRH